MAVGDVIYTGRSKSVEYAKSMFYAAFSEPAIKPCNDMVLFPMLVNDEIIYCQFEWIGNGPEWIQGDGLPGLFTPAEFKFIQVENPD